MTVFRRGFSIIEFIIASVLTLIVLTASGAALSSAERGMAGSRSLDLGSAVGVSTLEQAALFDCQRHVDWSPGTLGSLESVCSSIYGSGTPPAVSFTGDYMFTTILNGTEFVVEISSVWLHQKTSQTQTGLSSSSSGSSPVTCPSSKSGSAFRQPASLHREVTVSWSTAGSGFVSRRYAALESFYRQDTRAPKGGLVVQVPQGSYVLLKSDAAPDARPVARKGACSNQDGKAEVLFPYLAPGSYTYSVFSLPAVTDMPSALEGARLFRSLPPQVSLRVTVNSNSNRVCDDSGVCA